MRDVQRQGQGWTRLDVEASLIAAFREMPAIPVFARGARFEAAAGAHNRHQVTRVLGWAAMLTDDATGRKFLWAWARCQATRTSFAALCREMGWPRNTAETARRRGATAIAQALSEHNASA